MYSRLIETYLTVCVPELKTTVRQYGWSGETAPGFLARMTNDCLRFQPTIATTCYGMNDHGYRAYEPAIGQRYREASAAMVRAFKRAVALVPPKRPDNSGSSGPNNLAKAMGGRVGDHAVDAPPTSGVT
jgi:lysophospholipase L1-like esterase